jgi:hypothetical protein
MDQGNLFEFEGAELVAAMDLRRSQGRLRLTVTFTTPDGYRRLRFDNPDPLDEVFPIVDAEQAWVYLLPSEPAQPGRIKVEYYAGEFHEFTAETVLDLDPAFYDTKPDLAVEDLDPE